MRRVLVFTPDLMFYSQVKGTSEAAGWAVQRITAAPADGVSGDILVVDACRDLPNAWALLEAIKPQCPWLVMVCYQHVHAEVAEEALKRGATEAVRRGAFLTRLAERLGSTPPNAAPFVGAPPTGEH